MLATRRVDQQQNRRQSLDQTKKRTHIGPTLNLKSQCAERQLNTTQSLAFGEILSNSDV